MFRAFWKETKTVFLRLLFVLAVVWFSFQYFWGGHVYKVTAYCNCPICINVEKYRDGKFASGKEVYWGGAAGDPAIPLGSKIELVPLWPSDHLSIAGILKGKRNFTIEDRGGKIRKKCIDLFIPDSMGGHKTAKKWGVRYMRIKINGRLAA